MAKFQGVYIPSLDAKDIFISNNYVRDSGNGYSLYTRQMGLNLNRFFNTLDYSLELIKLREIYKELTGRDSGFSQVINGKEYCSRVINVTFNYSNKEWNKYGENLFVKFGHNLRDMNMSDGACVIDGELVAIEIDRPVTRNVFNYGITSDLFEYDPDTSQYRKISKNIKTLHTISELRKKLYEDGFICDGVKYIRYKRSSGSSRIGKCLFIEEALYGRMHEWECCGLDIQEDSETDLAAFESYISLPLSSIIDVIEIKKENILVIDDYDSVFNESSIVTEIKDKKLSTYESDIEIRNSIWDGQSIADSSLFGKYNEYGMILLRNRFFKSACFNCNLQQWFADNHITEVSQLNGFTLARDISEVKLITTPSSIKYLKFGSIEAWLSNIEEAFGLVKHEKNTKYFDGRMVKMHYQLLNSLQLSYNEVEQLVAPDLKYVDLLKTNPGVLRYHLRYSENKPILEDGIKSKNDIIFNLLGLNDDFFRTQLCRNFVADIIRSYYNNLRCGHLTISGTYAVLFGNPIEMLNQSIGKFDGRTSIAKGTIVNTFYVPGKTIVCSRSPHISFSNVLVSKNSRNGLIEKYFNLTGEIICVNSIEENIMNKLSGADYDSDSVLITDNEIIVTAALRNDGRFGIPFNNVDAKKIKRRYNASEKADLDNKTAVNLIGEIINFSQELNSLYWDNLADGQTHDENTQLYLDICQLDIMSRIEIDSAKKEFAISNKRELRDMKLKYHADGYRKPTFFRMLSDMKGFDPSNKDYRDYRTSMDYLQTAINSYRQARFSGGVIKFYEILSSTDSSGYNKHSVERIKAIVNECAQYVRDLWANNDKIDSFQKYILCAEKKEAASAKINKMKLDKATIVHILKSMDKKEYRRIGQMLLSSLFGYKNDEFYEMLIDSKSEKSFVYEDKSGNLEIFGFKFLTITK